MELKLKRRGLKMANLSYCRFQNTYYDLKDCVENFTSLHDLSKVERDYALKMRKLCEEYLELVEKEEEEND